MDGRIRNLLAALSGEYRCELKDRIKRASSPLDKEGVKVLNTMLEVVNAGLQALEEDAEAESQGARD